MTVTVITPTADRPVAFALAERWMARQTHQPDEWIVADGGQVPVTCTRGQRHLHEAHPPGARNFCGNLRRGLDAATGNVIVFIEDDDWYAPTHLETLLAQLHPGILAAGDDLQQYYNVPSRCWRQMNNRGASLCQTAMPRYAVPLFIQGVERCRRANTYGVDAEFWKQIPTTRRALQRTQTCVGIKGLPGQVGLGLGHRPTTGGPWRPDPQYAQLRRWIGADVDVYASLTQAVA